MLVDNSKIFLYGLPLDCQEGTLKDFLEAVCDNPGAVIKVSIPDKKTFAFVTLSCTEVAEHLLGNTLLYCDGVGQLYKVKACPYVKQPFKKKKVQDYKPETTSMEIIELKAVKYKPQDHVHQLTPDYSMLSHSKPKRRKRKRDELAIWLGDVGSTTFKRKTPRQKKRKKKASKLVLHKSESFQFGNLCPESKAITTNIEDTTDTTGAVEPVVHENGQRLSKVKDKVPEVEIEHADDQKPSSTISSHTQVIIDRDYLGPLCLQFTSPPSVADVKNELMEKTGLPVKEQLLCYNGKKLSDSLDLRPLIDDNPDSLTLVLSAVTLNGGAAPQHQANSPDVVADSASEPSVAPRHQAPPAEVAAAIAPEPLSELEACGPITTHKEASDPDCKDDFSRDSADSIHSLMATQHKMRNIITATMKFEAEHEECVRVLPYLEGDQVVVQFYVFSGESGIPKQLKLAAEECFEEMGVKCKWSDLYNDKTDILKVTPLEYPSGGPKRLNVSQVDEISEIISKNLHVLDQHRNVTSVQASFKITKSVQTDIPCITIYVLGKGFIPVGEFEFPHTIGPYPVDVVDGFWFRTAAPWTPNFAQEQSEVLRLGASIGIQGKKESGTLGAIVEGGSTYYALSSDHLMRYTEKEKSIIHPGLNDHLNYLKYHLRRYREMIKGITEHGSLGNEFSIEDIEESKELLEKYEVLKSTKYKHVHSERCTKEKLSEIQKWEKDFEEKLKAPRVIGNYTAGVRGNVKWNGKEYFVDAAIAELTANEIYSLRESGRAQMIGTTKCISGDCSEATTTAIMNAERLCKSGRTTQYTETHSLVGPHIDPPVFMKSPKWKIGEGPLVDVMTNVLPQADEVVHEQWAKNCLCMVQGGKTFADEGDSGAVIFELKEGLPGFGIIFAVLKTAYQYCVIASPLQVVLEALSENIPKDRNLKLVSKFELETCGQMTTNEKAFDPVCKVDISRDPADDVMENIVKATKNFEADHEECVRVLPYLEGGQVVVQFYVFSGESGIPQLLQEDAKKRFGGMEIKMNWSDLYNNVSNILKATPLKFRLGEQPKRLDVSEVDEISKIINENLAVFHQHRNVTSVQASFKITGSEQTDKPCITIYVLGKGFIPFGESEFPHTLGGYLVDVVDGFWFRTADMWKPNTAQEQSEVLCWGSSIGVQGKEASGTLGAIVEGGSKLYALSCDHVMGHGEKPEIIHPGWGDYLNYLKYHLNMYRKYIKRSTQCHCLETHFSVENLTDSEELLEKFQKLKTFKENFNMPEGGIKWIEDEIKEHEKKITNGLREPRVIGNYSFGICRNVKWTNGNEYFVDAAIAELTPEEENRLRESKTPKIIGNPDCPSGDCSGVTNEYISTVHQLCKSGRTTCYKETSSFDVSVDPPIFMKPPYFRKNGVLYDVGKHDFFCQTCAKQQPSQSKMVELSENTPDCGSCKEHRASICNEHWLKNCLCIVQGTKDFALEGDSGAVIFEQKDLIGFGIITAAHKSTHQSCVVATPLQVALEALSKEFLKDSNLKLVSNYGTPQNQTPSPE